MFLNIYQTTRRSIRGDSNGDTMLWEYKIPKGRVSFKFEFCNIDRMNRGKQTHSVFAYKYFTNRQVSRDSKFSWRGPGVTVFWGSDAFQFR
jgi:hypothetical protein